MDRLYVRMTEKLSEENYYEAHQICNTIFHRLYRIGKYDELLKFLFDNCALFARVKEYNIAADLTTQFISVLPKVDPNVSKEFVEKLREIYSTFPDDSDVSKNMKSSLEAVTKTEQPPAPSESVDLELD